MKKITILFGSVFLLILLTGFSLISIRTRTAGPTQLKANISSITNILCNGNSNGIATVTASRGTMPYTYLWLPDSNTTATNSGLASGTYTVYVRDAANDSVILTVTITQPNLLRDSITSLQNVTCAGGHNGSASAGVAGGTLPYTYLWMPGGGSNSNYSGLSPGLYFLTVTDNNGCTVNTTANIGVRSNPVTSVAVTNVSCFGEFNGTGFIHISGGIAPFRYRWLPIPDTTQSVTGLPAGTYTGTVTDALGCRATGTAAVGQPLPLSVIDTIYTNIAAIIARGGTAPYTYKWYPSVSTTAIATGLSAGTYTVTVHDSNFCSDSIAFTLVSSVTLPNLFFTFPTIGQCGSICGSPSYAYFPIMAVSSDTVGRFNNCVVDINIGNGEFKGDSVSNGGIIVTHGGQFLPGPGNDYDSLTVTNLSDSVIEIRLGNPADSSPNGTIVSNGMYTSDTIFYVKLEIQNPCITTKVTFADTGATRYSSSYTVPAGSPYTFQDSALNVVCVGCKCDSCDFDNTCYCYLSYCCLDSFNYRHFDTIAYATTNQNSLYNYTGFYGSVYSTDGCYLYIADFNDTIRAGVGDTLTITGWGFGANRGKGFVVFDNADGPLSYVDTLNALDYLSWNNYQIKIRLPAFADSIFSSPQTQATTGSGMGFVVQNSCSESVQSGINARGYPFFIYYNIHQERNTSYPSLKEEVLLRSADTNGGYVIRFDSSTFPKDSIQRKIFTKAMRDWTCYTGVNWTVGPDTTYTYSAGHYTKGLNYVFFTPSLLLPNEVASTDMDVHGCVDSVDILLDAVTYFNKNMHFVYDTTGTVAINNGQEDFYGVCLHELGHFIGLNHTTGPIDLMYYTANQGPIAPANRITLAKSTSGSAVAGGIFSVKQSVDIPSLCNSLSAMTGKHTECINVYDGIKEVQVPESANFVLYPNPSNGTFTVESSMNDYTLVIMNMLGQTILTRKIQSDKTEINLSSVPSGMYFIQEQYKNGIATQKLIITKK